MVTRFIEVLDPTSKALTRQTETAPRVDNLNGKVIGLVDNRKPNFDIFLARLEELLKQKLKFAGIVHIKKGEMNMGASLSAEDIEKLAKNCDVVLNGICD
jgi:hypothetical protein